MANDIKRLNYFTGQYLVQEDFLDEQTYHKEMRWRRNRVLYGPGVLEGMLVSQNASKNGISISPGTALNDQGRELVFVDAATQAIPNGLTGKVNVIISYEETPTDYHSVGEYKGATRFTEKPKIDIQVAPATVTQITLACLQLDANSSITSVDTTIRQLADARFPRNLTTNGSVGIGTTAPGDKLVVSGGRIGHLESGSMDGNGKWSTLGVPSLGFAPNAANCYGLKVNWDTDAVVFGLKDYGANKKDAIIAWGDDPDNNLRFLKQNDADAMIITGDGNVGIGTTDTKSYRLMVAGGDTRMAGPGQEQSLFGLDRLVGVNDLRFYVDDSGTTEQMHLSPSGLTITGNVGIGTTAPGDKLVVSGGRIGHLESGSMDGNGKWSTLGVPNLGFAPNAANCYGLKVNWDTDAVVFGLKDYGANKKDAIIAWGDDPDNNLRFLKPNDADAMIITGAGNVGIGTTDPKSYRLMVTGGDTRIAGPGQEQGLFGLDRLVGLNDLRFYVDDSGTIEKMHLGSDGLTVNGNVTIGGSISAAGKNIPVTLNQGVRIEYGSKSLGQGKRSNTYTSTISLDTPFSSADSYIVIANVHEDHGTGFGNAIFTTLDCITSGPNIFTVRWSFTWTSDNLLNIRISYIAIGT